MIYSGYRFEELTAEYQNRFDEICTYIDILIDGEYVEALNDNRAYRGSSNQTIHFLSDKYRLYQEQMNQRYHRNVEFEMDSGGNLVMIGIPPKGFQEELMRKAMKEKNTTKGITLHEIN